MARFAICSIHECGKRAHAKTWCAAHYRRFQIYGDPLGGGPDKPRGRICSIDGCDGKSYGQGYCRKHYERLKRNGDPLTVVATQKGEPLAWLMEARHYDGDECLIYPYNRSIEYGRIVVEGEPQLAHRIMCEWVNGPPPEDKPFTLHSCGKGRDGCVTPKHLRWGTAQENSDDMIAHGTVRNGETNHNAKLTEDDVRAIRAARGIIRQVDLAEMYGVSGCRISMIQTRKAWGWLD